MPAQTQKVSLAGKYGDRAKKAAAAHANDPIKYGLEKLPPGIDFGVAQLTSCEFRKYKAESTMKQADGSSAVGQLYLFLAGTVVAPKTIMHDGMEVPIAGMQTYLNVPIMDKGHKRGDKILTFEDCIATAQNELKKIGGEQFNVSDVDSAMESLLAAAPYFKFSTSLSKGGGIDPKTKQPYPPRTYENWNGSKGLENFTPEDATEGAVDDGTGEDAPAADEPKEEFNEFGDLDSMAELADGSGKDQKTKDTRQKLKKLAIEKGISEEAIDNSDSWAAVVEMIKNGPPEEAAAEEPAEEAAEEEAADEAPPEPTKGSIWFYKKRDKNGNPLKDKNTKKEMKSLECEVLTVDKKNKKVTLKDITGGKTILGADNKPLQVDWDLLETE